MSNVSVNDIKNRMEIEQNTAGEILTHSNRLKDQIIADKVALNDVVHICTYGRNKLQAELIRNNALGIIKRVEQMRKAASLIQTLRQLNF